MPRDKRSTDTLVTTWSIIIVACALSACTGGQTATMGSDAADPLASERLSTQEIAGITPGQSAPKRRPEEPILVTVAPMAVDSKMRQAEKPKGAFTQHLRDEFASDPIIQLIPEQKGKIGRKTSSSVARTSDVEVASKVSLKEVLGMNSKTGKVGKTVNVVFEATITSQSPPMSYVVLESGPVLQNMAVAKRFAQQIRETIVEKIGPEIPAR